MNFLTHKTSFLAISLLAMLPLQMKAQKLKDFQEAMKTKREFGKGYVLSKRYKDEKVRQAASENGFKIVGVNFQGHAMFVPLEEYETYKFENDGYDHIHNFNQGYSRSVELKNTVTPTVKANLEGYVAIRGDERVNRNLKGTDFKLRGDAYLYENDHFVKFEKTFWTGELNNGLITGRGDGFIVLKNEKGENIYRSFSGNFKDGLPNGKVIIARGFPDNGQGWRGYMSVSKDVLEVGNLCEGLAKYVIYNNGRKKLYGYIDDHGNIIISPTFKEANDFLNGVAYVTPENTEVKIDKKGNVIALSENAKMSFDEMLYMRKKYPHLASSIEIEASKYIKKDLTYEELQKVESEFPNLKMEIAPLKYAIYKSDCQQLQTIYQKALAAANAKESDMQGNYFVRRFINRYTSNDPDKKMTLARELSDYYIVCEAKEIKVKRSYWHMSGNVPKFDSDGYTQQSKLLQANDILSSNSINTKFRSFYTDVLVSIKTNYKDITYKLDRDEHEYKRARGNYESEKQQEQAKREVKSALLEVINESSVFKYVVSQDENWSGGRIFDTDTNYDDHKTIKFIEIDNKNITFKTTIHKVRRGSKIYYYSDGGDYSTYQDAVCAAYLCHYKKEWRHNKL